MRSAKSRSGNWWGVLLHDESVRIAAAECKQTASHVLELTLTQGSSIRSNEWWPR
jgi:hypothetical protein